MKSEELKRIFERARSAYYPVLEKINCREEIYAGTHKYRYGKRGNKVCQNVRNITYELIESQIDTGVPLPVVNPVCASDEEKARMVQESIKADIARMDLARVNDILERIVPVQGFGIFEIYWDEEVKVRPIHPMQFIPQPGVCEIQEMDYFFIVTSVTKRYIGERYGADLAELLGGESSENPEELCEEVVCWYRGESGEISRCSFCGDVVLEETEDFYLRREKVCKECGALWESDAEECPICGGARWKEQAVEYEELRLTEGGITRKVSAAYYHPKEYPFVIWENVPKNFTFGGQSDVDVIADQQEIIKRLYTKVEQKLLKGGSFVQVPANMQSRLPIDEEELRVIYSNPMDAPVSVHTIQPDISKDLTLIQDQIKAAQATLGLNDSFQGKSDPTAVSGTAKRLLIEQANGRLSSKQANKYRAYRELYRKIFEFKLAFLDEVQEFVKKDVSGKRCYCHFSRQELLKEDGYGEWRYEDRFEFSVDASGGLPHDRGYLYEQAMKLYQIGGFGACGSAEALKRLWRCLESVQFPLAAQVSEEIMKSGSGE